MPHVIQDSAFRAPVRPSFNGLGLEGWAICAFAATIFYGDLYFGITIPLAVLVLLIVFVSRARSWRAGLSSLPAGFFLLACLAIPIAVQTALGYGPRGKSDLVVYLPLAYGALTMIALAGARLPDRVLSLTLLASGVFAGIVLVATLLFVSPDRFAVPGQNPVVAEQRQEEVRAVLRDEPRAPDAKVPEFKVSPGMDMYYAVKNRARTPLGMSNFLAAVFVFLYVVTLYQRSRWAVLFAALVMVTGSRTGAGFLVIALAVWLAGRTLRLRRLVLLAGGVSAAGVVVWMMLGHSLLSLPGAESLGARMWYMTTAFYPIAENFLFGAPRSETIRLFGYPITWTPHNSILHLTVLFGVVGVVAYAAYAWVIVTALRRRAAQSDLWRGISVGVILLFAWSLMEIIVMQPSFEILMAALYSLARGRPASS